VRPPAEAIASLGWVVGGIALVILAGVEIALVYAAWRYRASRGGAMPAQIHGHPRLEVAWTATPLVVLAVVFALMIGTMREIGASVPDTGPGALRIRAIAYQWWWEFRYPGEGGDVVTANELHIPAGTPVVLDLEAHDVVHSFWVPQLNGKTDMIPGRVNHLRLFAARPGSYPGQCAEFCGMEHAWMRITVIADAPGEFSRWLAGQTTPRAPPLGTAAAGEAVFLANVCQSCHAIRGTGAVASAGPDLTHLASRSTLGSGVLRNDEGSLRAWLADPQRYKPGAFMPSVPLSTTDLDALVAYLRSLR
jgi:cytochrome c oxidase subunit 2